MTVRLVCLSGEVGEERSSLRARSQRRGRSTGLVSVSLDCEDLHRVYEYSDRGKALGKIEVSILYSVGRGTLRPFLLLVSPIFLLFPAASEHSLPGSAASLVCLALLVRYTRYCGFGAVSRNRCQIRCVLLLPDLPQPGKPLNGKDRAWQQYHTRLSRRSNAESQASVYKMANHRPNELRQNER